jgi:hypothetical protein
MSDEPKKRSRAWMGWAAIGFLLLAYPFSVGPALRFAFFSGNRRANLDAVYKAYAPIWWLRQHSDTARAVIDRYKSFWLEDR